ALVHLVQVGRAVGTCRATFPTTPGVITRPLTGTPLTWRHLLGWHTVTQRDALATTVLAQARMAHAGVAARSDSYTAWLSARRDPVPPALPYHRAEGRPTSYGGPLTLPTVSAPPHPTHRGDAPCPPCSDDTPGPVPRAPRWPRRPPCSWPGSAARRTRA